MRRAVVTSPRSAPRRGLYEGESVPVSDRAPPALDPVALATVAVLIDGRAALTVRCLDAAGEGEARDLGGGLRATLSDSGRASLRWHPDAPAALLPALSVHERARLHLTLAEGVTLGELPGRLQPLDPAGRSVLWTLDGHAGLGALTLARGGRDVSLPLRVRARWDEPTALVTVMMREVCAARWSAAVREEAGALTLPAGLEDRARRDDEARVVLALLADDPALREALAAVRRSPSTALRSELGALRPEDPRMSEVLAARGEDPDAGWMNGLPARAPRPALSVDTAEGGTLRALLDALGAGADALGEGDRGLRHTFAAWRDALPWLAGVPPREDLRAPPRSERHRVFARCLAQLRGAGPSLRLDAALGVSLWDSPTLYERWCALELARALAVDEAGAVGLLEGRGVALTAGGLALRVEVQRRFGALLPTAFRPDLTVSRGERRVHLDAKYRLDPARGDGAVVREELVKMHAYRDAIPGSVGAYALFPGGAAEALDGRDARGGVGALPLRADLDPGARDAQRARLRDVLCALLG
jgi:hypothetical protein